LGKQIGQAAWMTTDQLLAIVCLLEGIWCHGEARGIMWSKNQLLKLSIEPCHKG
jgi:hypothetical protein